MKCLRFVICFSVMVIGFFAPAYGNDPLLETIILNHAFCMKAYRDGKLYLHAGKIRKTSTGAYLVLNDQGDMLELPQLSEDSDGPFYSIPIEEFRKHLQILNQSPRDN